METTTVLFIWQPNEVLKKYFLDNLQEFPNLKLIFPTDTSEEYLLSLVPQADIIIGWRPTKKLLDAASKLSLFINPGVGVQHLIPLFQDLSSSRYITLVNGHGNTYFTAQHAVALLLALTNKVVPHHNWMISGLWRKGDSDAISLPLRSKTIGLLGYGALNQKIHRFLSGFDLSFAILRKDWSKQDRALPTLAQCYSPSELDAFLKSIDILIIGLPLTSHTKGLIGTHELSLLGPNGLLINVGRGEVVDEESLYTALKNQTILGAAIDVWYNYSPQPSSDGHLFPSAYPFYSLNNVVLSPHRAASPFNDLKRWDEQIENIRRFIIKDKPYLNIVNLDEGY